MRLFHDSAAYFAPTAAARLRKWDAEPGDAVPQGPNTTYSPFDGGYGYAVGIPNDYGAGGVGGWMQKNFPGNKQITFSGMWMRPFFGNTQISAWAPIFTWRDGVDTQMQIAVKPDGAVIIWRGHMTTGVQVAASVPGVIDLSLHQFVSAKCKIDNAAGEVIVRVNDTQVVSFSGDTQVTANAYATNIWVGGRPPNPSFSLHFSDFRVNDDSGAKNNSFPVPSRILCLFPTGDGVSSDYTRNVGASDWEAVDEVQSDDDTTYIESSTVGHVSYFDVQDPVAFNAAVFAVAVNTIDKRDDVGARTARHKIRFGAGPTVSNGAAYSPAAAQYTNSQTIFEDTISQSELDGLQIGAEVMS